MNRTFWLFAGLAGGVLLTLGVQSALRTAEDMNTQRATPSPTVLAELRAENERLREAVETEKARNAQLSDSLLQQETGLEALAERAPTPAPDASSPKSSDPGGLLSDVQPTDEDVLTGVGEFAKALGEIMQGGGEEAKKELRGLLARAGKHGVDLLVAKFDDDATDIGLRFAIAHALAQSGNPEAIASLTGVLADPAADMLSLRLASHGLAFSDAEGIDDALLGVAHRAADTGARANAAFGLARRGNQEGVGLYMKATDEALANRDPAALQYLASCAALGDEALPLLRERLLTYTEPQAALTLIEILKTRGDTGALENLRKLAADEGRPASTRRSAEGAIKALESEKK